MREFLAVCLDVSIIFFLATAMLNVGMSLTLRQILEPLRNVPLTIKSLATSFILVPLIAVLIARIIQLEEPLKIGLVLLSLSAGTEAGPKVIGMAKGNIAFSVALMGLQIVVTIIYVPFIISVLLPETNINISQLLIKLFVLVFLPLILGLFLKARHDAIAGRLNHLLHGVSTFFMILIASLVIVLHSAEMLQLVGTGAIIAGMLFIVTSFAAGYLTGGPGRDTRLTLGFMSSARNLGIAFMIASQAFDDPDVILMIGLTLILMLGILIPTAFWFSRRNVA